MRADEAQALVARCLVDPGYLDGAAGPLLPRALRGELLQFRGFITRIKHTQLRRVAPLTLRLLALHRRDIAVFAGIAPGYLQARAAGPLPERDLFARFEREVAERLPSLPEPGGQQVAAMLRHEGRIWRAGRAVPYAYPAPHPRLRPGTAVERYPLDVVGLAAAVERDRFTVPATEAGDRFVLYRAGNGTVDVSEVDPLGAWLLSRLNGTAAAGDLTAELGAVLEADAADVVRDLLADAAARELLDPAEA